MANQGIGPRLEGVNWSIERGLVPAETAQAAAQEILEGIATRNPLIKFDHEDGFTGYVVEGWQDLRKKEVADPAFRFAALMEVRTALQPFKDPKLLKDRKAKHYDVGYVNITEAHGRVPMHRDSEPWSLVFVSLAGRAAARIRHKSEAAFAETELEPGDALRIVNPKAMKQRPKHELFSLSDFARISYGEYTSPHKR
jgi:hypothetical protein